MNSKSILAIQTVLAILAAFLAYKVYRVIMEPIEFENLQSKRYEHVKKRLEQIREAELTYKGEFAQFQGDIDQLVQFVDTGKVSIYERKDSSFMRYNKKYQKDMNVDTVIVRLIGQEYVKNRLFGPDFDAQKLLYIPFSDNVKFTLGASTIERNGVKVPVFEVKAPNAAIFADQEKTYGEYIDKDYALTVGSLTEPSVSGNWK